MSGDVIVLTLPRERDFHRVAHLVLGGLALRLNLTLEVLEDLQLAVDGLLESGSPGSDVNLSMKVLPDALEASIGPFEGQTVRHELEREDDGVGLRRVLDTTMDRVEVAEREGGEWVRLTKRIES